MDVAIIGAGNIGATLARRLALAGHSVTLGVRDPEDPKVTSITNETAVSAASPVAATTGADAVVLAIPASAVVAVLGDIGPLLDGTVVVDATNNIGGNVADARDAISTAAPGARYVRAFNSLGWENFADPHYGEETADGFYAADDDADAVARELIGAVGLNPVRVGGADQVAVVDGLLRLWFALAFGQGRGRDIAFKLLSR